jgi:hypothetical protein
MLCRLLELQELDNKNGVVGDGIKIALVEAARTFGGLSVSRGRSPTN